MRFRREMATSDRPALFFLVLFTVVCTISGLLYPDFMPFTTLLLPMFIGSLWLGPRSLPWFIVFVCVCVVILLLDQPLRRQVREVALLGDAVAQVDEHRLPPAALHPEPGP